MSKIRVKVQSKDGVIWEGEGDSCSMFNSLGQFDILAQHTQFVTPISQKIVVRNDNQITWEYQLDTSALCRVKDNQVEIWVGV